MRSTDNLFLQLALLRQLVGDAQLVVREFHGLPTFDRAAKLLGEFDRLIVGFERSLAESEETAS